MMQINRRRWLLGLLVLLGLSACQGDQPPAVQGEAQPLSLNTLKLPIAQVPGTQRIEIKSEIDTRRFPAEDAPVAVRGLRTQNIVESAYYKYHLAEPEGASYKLKLSIYADKNSRASAWDRNYQEALTQGVERRAWGDAGLIVPNKAGAFALGRVIAHVEASGGAPALEQVLQRLYEQALALQPE